MADQQKIFETEHLRENLGTRSARGGLVTLGSQGVKFALTLGSTAVLARLLTPGDFGLVAMVAAIVGFATLFKDLGLSMATIQREKINHSQISTLFWINVAVSALLSVLVAAAAPLVAWLYGDDRLIAITIALGATFLFGGLTSQHLALLRRQMRFSALAVIEIVSLLLSILSAIAIAAYTHSYWALVAMTATQALSTMMLSWIFSGWVPGRAKWDKEVQGMLAFGGHLTGFNALNYFVRNLDNILIGSVFGAGALGLYSRAYGLLMLPIRQINGPITSVAMPALSRLQSDPLAYRRFFLRTISLLFLVTAPIVGYAFADADLIVLALLGEQWSGAIAIFRWLAPAALIGAINIVPGWLCSSLGRTDVQMRWAIWSAPLISAGFVIGLYWGPVGVAASFSLTFTLAFLVFIAMACRISPVSVLDLWQVLRHILFSVVLASALLMLFKQIIPMVQWPLLLRLCATMPVFALCFLGALAMNKTGRDQIRRLTNLSAELREQSK